MLVLVCYDVATTSERGKRRLHKVARACSASGGRVQLSVFECEVDPAQWERLRQRLVDAIDPAVDSLRFYFLGSNWSRRVEHVGQQRAPDMQGLLLVEDEDADP